MNQTKQKHIDTKNKHIDRENRVLVTREEGWKVKALVDPSICLLSTFLSTPWTVALLAPLSMESPGKNTEAIAIPLSKVFSWPRDGTRDALQADSLPSKPPGKPEESWREGKTRA